MDTALLRQSLHAAATMHYSRSGGPGGQNVNKVNTKVTVHLPLNALMGLSEAEMGRVREILKNRITAGDEIVISASEERSRLTNQERAFARLLTLIAASARVPKHRRPTKPSRAAREKRMQSKKIRALIKQNRRLPPKE
jgi:ribosome-associated protein